MFLQPSTITKETSFYYLCKYDYYSIVFMLLKSPDIDINMKVEDNKEMLEKKQTALYLAVEKENIEIIKLLLSNSKIDVNILNECTTSFMCVMMGYTANKSTTALYLAVEKENIEIIKLLLSISTIDVNIINNVSLSKLRKDIEINKNQTALYLAVEKENIEIIKLLLSINTIDVNIVNKGSEKTGIDSLSVENTALCLAIEKQDIEIIKLLLLNDKINVNILNKESRYSVDLDDKKDGIKIEIDQTVLYLAVEIQNVEIIKLLLSNKTIDVNILSKKSGGIAIKKEKGGKKERGRERELEQTALYLAVEKENVEITKLLLSHSTIDVNILNKNSIKQSEDSIMRMRLIGHCRKIGVMELDGPMESLISSFLEEFKKMKKENNEEEEEEEKTEEDELIEKTALYLAVEIKNIEIIKLLLSNERINVNILNKSESGNKTTLHLAVEKEYIEIIKLLLNNKEIDINIEDD